MILVDTSVWIDFFRGRNTPQRRELHRLIDEGHDVALTGIILQEILQGIQEDILLRQTQGYLERFDYLRLIEPETFVNAAAIFRRCSQRGKTIAKPVDCLIAAQAMAADTYLLHRDSDFTRIAEIVPLRIHPLREGGA